MFGRSVLPTVARIGSLCGGLMYDWLQRVWYEGAPSGVVLWPLSWLFRGVVVLRRRLYVAGILRSFAVGRPVVVVGNISVGGTGKTPLTIWLARQLADGGLRVGVASRGYGGSARSARLVTANDDPAVAGDEPVLIARSTNARVAVGADRVEVARLLAGQGCEVILADDGLQHLRLRRDVEIAVVDGQRRFGNGRLLPAGPLREPVARLQSVAAVVVNGGASQPPEIGMSMAPLDAVSLADPARSRPLSTFCGQPVHAVAAIGNPGRFFDLLRRAGVAPIEHPWPDHAAPDVRFHDRLPVLMTEKDAVKCRALADERHWYVAVRAQIAAADAERLLRIVLAGIGRRELPVIAARQPAR